jgi:signal transduction histidine kinase
LLEIASVSCGLDIPLEWPEHSLDPKFRQEIFFAFKEALTNIVRHAKATKVWLRIAVTDANPKYLVVEVSDDGRGFDAQMRHAGHDGIANMHERLKSLGGVCEIASDPKTGTTVRFRAPLPDLPL